MHGGSDSHKKHLESTLNQNIHKSVLYRNQTQIINLGERIGSSRDSHSINQKHYIKHACHIEIQHFAI